MGAGGSVVSDGEVNIALHGVAGGRIPGLDVATLRPYLEKFLRMRKSGVPAGGSSMRRHSSRPALSAITAAMSGVRCVSDWRTLMSAICSAPIQPASPSTTRSKGAVSIS